MTLATSPMRIPFSSQDRSLYPQHDVAETDRGSRRHRSVRTTRPGVGGASAGAATIRRLIRLVIALVVVLVVMRRAGDASLYQAFFPKTTFPAESETPFHPGASSRSDVGSIDNGGNGTDSVDPSGVGSSADLAQASRQRRQTLAGVVDGATWRSEDKPAFDLLLDQAAGMKVDEAAKVGPLALLQQPDSHRGRLVRIDGEVVRVDAIGDDFQLWIKPADGTNRPVIAVVKRTPAGWKRQLGSALPRPVDVVIVGRFLKRLAYRSGKGADVAPVVIGRIVRYAGAQVAGSRAAGPRAAGAAQGAVGAVRWSVLLAAVVVAITWTAWISYRGRAALRRMRQRRQAEAGHRIDLSIALPWGILLLAMQSSATAQSAMDLLGKFDQEALVSASPMQTESQIGEIAKLLYRTNRLSAASAQAREVDPDQAVVGDVVSFAGTMTSVSSVQVPQALAEYLEFDRFDVITLQSSQSGVLGRHDLKLVCRPTPSDARRGDRLEGLAVLIRDNAERTGDTDRSAGRRTMVCMNLQWTPSQVQSVGWKLLSDAGFNLAWMDGIRKRDRNPLLKEDHDPFFSMLAVAKKMDPSSGVAKRVPLVDLLSQPDTLVGDFLRVELQTVRWTKVRLSDSTFDGHPSLGQDHYFQIDAMGDLGDVQVRIESSEPGGEPLVFDRRFPVSIVSASLPGWMTDDAGSIDASNDVSASWKQRVVVDGFFYRLWSYESDLSQRTAKSSAQFGPLMMAVDIRPVDNEREDPVGIHRVGWAICGVLLVGFAAIVVWNYCNWREDRQLGRTRDV